MTTSPIPVTHTKTVPCTKFSAINVGALRALLEGVPDEAEFKIVGAYSGQRDSSNGTATVEWRS